MPWSDDARLLLRPFRTYRELARVPLDRPLVAAAGRAARLLFVLGACVSLTATGRLVAAHVAFAMLSWAFVPILQGAVLLAVVKLVAPAAPLDRALWMYFAGHAPFLLLFSAIAAACPLAPALYRTGALAGALGAIAIGIVAALFWSGTITYALFREGIGLSRRRATATTALFYAGTTLAVVGYYVATNQLPPLLASA